MPFKVVPPLYSVWRGMFDRCYNKNRKQWKDYGGRGIKVCKRWRVFETFVIDMGPRPTTKHTIDRKDNDKDYSPSNCKWSTRKEQQRNQTVTRKIVIEGIEYIAADLSEKYGVKTDTIICRAKEGLAFEAIVQPKKLRWDRGRPKDCCINGHPYTPENTRILPNGRRVCRACGRLSAQKAYWIKKEST